MQNHWTQLLETLRAAQPVDYSKAGPLFRSFAKSVPEGDRIPLLLDTYERYRGCSISEGDFRSSDYSMLISALLKEKLKPSEEQACSILRASFHFCGHGDDGDPPLILAEKAFEGKPYSQELFAAVRDYQKVLKGLRATSLSNVKRKLQWIVWHDPAEIDKKCWMGRVQADLAAMPDKERFSWQWLLRNTTATATGAAGKAWLKEGEKRMAALGEAAFLAKLDEWLRFPADQPVVLTPAGSNILRFLVWYGSLVDTNKSLPILLRLADVQWAKREPVEKVMGAFCWFLRVYGGDANREVAERMAREWGGAGEGARLEEVYLPEVAAAKKAAMEERGAAFRDLVNSILKR